MNLRITLIFLSICAVYGVQNYINDTSEISYRRPRLIGALPANRGEAPYIVQMRTRHPPNSSVYVHLCSGTIVDRFNVVTPGHCAYSCQRFGCRAYVGLLGATGEVEIEIVDYHYTDTFKTDIVNISQTITDPWYWIRVFHQDDVAGSGGAVRDLALLNTNYIPRSENIRAASLPKTNLQGVINVVLSGFGPFPMLRAVNTTATFTAGGARTSRICADNRTIGNCMDYGAPMVIEADEELVGMGDLRVVKCDSGVAAGCYVWLGASEREFISTNLHVGEFPDDDITTPRTQTYTGIAIPIYIFFGSILLVIVGGIIICTVRRIRDPDF